MADLEKNQEIEDIAGGWIQERKGTEIPTFLKLSYIVVALGVLSYLVMYINGVVNDTPRGELVRQFDSFTTPANGFMYFVAALVAIYAVITVIFAFKKSH